MSWIDIFYPGNPERRENLIRKSQSLLELMKSNFRATNDLIKIVNKHMGLSFSPISLNEKATVKQNCDVMIKCIRKIQAEVEKIDQKLKKKLEPTLYEKLRNHSSMSAQDLKRVGQVISVVCVGATVVASAVVVWLIKNEYILTGITGRFAILGSCTVGVVALGVLFLGIDMIVSAILGSIERDQLEKALKEYDEVLDEFRPASEEYQNSITEVKVRIKIMEE